MLTKKEWCGLTLLGCGIGLAGAAITNAALWAMVYRPVMFWTAVVAGAGTALVYMLALAVDDGVIWMSERRGRVRTTYICLTCGMSTPSKARYASHRCVVRRLRKGEGEL